MHFWTSALTWLLHLSMLAAAISPRALEIRQDDNQGVSAANNTGLPPRQGYIIPGTNINLIFVKFFAPVQAPAATGFLSDAALTAHQAASIYGQSTQVFKGIWFFGVHNLYIEVAQIGHPAAQSLEYQQVLSVVSGLQNFYHDRTRGIVYTAEFKIKIPVAQSADFIDARGRFVLDRGHVNEAATS